MDSIIGPGIYWVTINIKATVIEYFDSFGIYAPMEVVQLSNKVGFNYIYNSTQYQDLLSELCGYFCLHGSYRILRGKFKDFSTTSLPHNLT